MLLRLRIFLRHGAWVFAELAINAFICRPTRDIWRRRWKYFQFFGLLVVACHTAIIGLSQGGIYRLTFLQKPHCVGFGSRTSLIIPGSYDLVHSGVALISPRDCDDRTLGVDRRTVEAGGTGASACSGRCSSGPSLARHARRVERCVVGAWNRGAVA